VTAPSGSLPFPPIDLGIFSLPTVTIPKGRWGYRSHEPGRGAVWFRPGSTKPPYRFDDPLGVYRVCYIGNTKITAFAETFLRDLPTRTVTEIGLRSRAISTIHFGRDLLVVRAYGKGLVQLGTTAALAGAKLTGALDPYEHSQAWSRAIFEHPDVVDGIQFKSSHDDDLRCLAVFDRAQSALADAGDARIIWEDTRLLVRLIGRYRLEII